METVPIERLLPFSGSHSQGLDSYYAVVGQEASETHYFLSEAWKRPVRHNAELERMALSCALRLDEYCQMSFGETAYAVSLPPGAAPETSYELRSGILNVATLLPYSPVERDIFRTYAKVSAIESDAELSGRPLGQRWHRWLWITSNEAPQNRETPSPEAMIFGIACKRLMHATLALRRQLRDPNSHSPAPDSSVVSRQS